VSLHLGVSVRGVGREGPHPARRVAWIRWLLAVVQLGFRRGAPTRRSAPLFPAAAPLLCWLRSSPLGVRPARDACRPCAIFFSFSGTMLPRSTASTSNVIASTVTPVVPRNYHLPGDDEAKAWRDLLLPFAGRLRLPHNSGRRKKAVCQCFGGPVPEPQPAVDVWLQCGLHYCTVSDGDVTVESRGAWGAPARCAPRRRLCERRPHVALHGRGRLP